MFAAWMGHAEPEAALALRGSLAAFAAVAGGVSGAIARGVGRRRSNSSGRAWHSRCRARRRAARAAAGLAGALVAITLAIFSRRSGFFRSRATNTGAPRRCGPFASPALAIAAGSFAGAGSPARAAVARAARLGRRGGSVALVVLATRHLSGASWCGSRGAGSAVTELKSARARHRRQRLSSARTVRALAERGRSAARGWARHPPARRSRRGSSRIFEPRAGRGGGRRGAGHAIVHLAGQSSAAYRSRRPRRRSAPT